MLLLCASSVNFKKQVSTLAEASQIEVLFASTHLFFIYVLLHIPFSLTIINIFSNASKKPDKMYRYSQPVILSGFCSIEQLTLRCSYLYMTYSDDSVSTVFYYFFASSYIAAAVICSARRSFSTSTCSSG